MLPNLFFLSSSLIFRSLLQSHKYDHLPSFVTWGKRREDQSWELESHLEVETGDLKKKQGFEMSVHLKVEYISWALPERGAEHIGFDSSLFFWRAKSFFLRCVGDAAALNQRFRSRAGHIWAIKYPDWSWLGYQIPGRRPRVMRGQVYLVWEKEMLFLFRVGWLINEDICRCCGLWKTMNGENFTFKDRSEAAFFLSFFFKEKAGKLDLL